MAALSSYLANQVIDHMLRNQAFTPPATVYLALFIGATGLSTDAPTLEVTGAGYARQEITLSEASGGTSSNSAVINFPIAEADWGEITHVAIVDHETNDTWGTNVHVLTWAAVTDPQTVNTGMLLQVDAGAIDFSVT